MELQQSCKEMKMKKKFQAKFSAIDSSIHKNTLTNSNIGGRKNVGKFRPWLIELTSFKPKLLIRFIMNKTC